MSEKTCKGCGKTFNPTKPYYHTCQDCWLGQLPISALERPRKNWGYDNRDDSPSDPVELDGWNGPDDFY